MANDSNTLGHPFGQASRYAQSTGIKYITAATTLGVDEQHAVVTLPGTSTYAITLPEVGAARGRIFVIEVGTDGSGVATVQDQDETPVPYTSANLTALNDYIIVWSSGRQWYEIKELTT